MSTLRRAALAIAIAVATSPCALAQQPIVLQWQTANLTESQYEPVWKQTIAEFEAANPGIRVEPVLVARKDHWTKFVAASQAKKAPCIVSVDLTTAAYNGYLMPLDKFWNAEPAEFRKAFSDPILAAAKWKGQLYGLPIWGGTYAEIYNRDLVTKAGLDPSKPPRTFDEYAAWGRKLTAGDHWATAVLGGKTDTTTRVLLTWIWANGGEAFNADMTEATFAKNPKSLEAIKYYLAFAGKNGIAAPAPTTTNYLEQTTLFAQGKIATMRNAYWAVAKVEGDNPAMKGRMFVAPNPANVPNAPTLATMTASSISASCPNPDAAWKFIKFDAGRKWSIARAKVSNWMPLRNDLADDPEIKADPLLAQFVRIGQNARSYPLPSPIWADIAANDIVDAVQKALLAPDKTDEIFRDLDVRLTRKLRDI
ncbi:MAG TPA: sugar ABC transporter substrate-binding protein [Casimicrobiaceae bacterium]|nr:sugar ABC transporter substrate-binding protein [Casimicrobiaceae bacterium]